MKRKSRTWTIVILFVILVVSMGAYLAFAMQVNDQAQISAVNEASTQTAIARNGDLMVFASSTGQLVSQNETTLKFDENGTLVELLVSVGDQVFKGDVLAQLQVNKSEALLAADIAGAKLAVIEDQQILDALYAEAEIASAQALFDLEVAQQELADLQNNDLALAQALQAVAEAEVAIQDAEMMIYIHNSSPSEDDIYTAYASLLFKEKEYNELKDQLAQLEYEYKKTRGKAARDRVRAQIENVTAQMYNQQVEFEEALYHYETIDDPADSLDLNLAQAQMDTAQAQLDQANLNLAQAQMGAPAGDIAQAEAKVNEAQTELERWQDGPDPQEVLLAEIRLEASQLDLQLAEREGLIVDLIAPMDGTVMQINAAVNEYIDDKNILTLADTSQLLIEVYLDESDYQNARIGNRVEVIFDALPDRTFTGLLVEIDPGLERVSNSQVVHGTAVLDEAAFTFPFGLPVGLNASVDVVAGEATGAVLVPIEALHETGPGKFNVFVLVNDFFEPRDVSVGLKDFTSVEITAGLEAGEVVAIGDVGLE